MTRRIRPKSDFALAQRVEQLWERFDYPEIDANVPFELAGGGSGMASYFVAGSNASENEQNAADALGTGEPNGDEIAISKGIEYMKQAGSVGGTLWLAGDFTVRVDGTLFDLASGAGTVNIVGLGNNSKTSIGVDASSSGGILFDASNNAFRNIQFFGGGEDVEAIRVNSGSSELWVIDCGFSNFDPSTTAAVEVRSAQGVWIERCSFSSSANRDILINAGAHGSRIANCRFTDTGGPPIRFRGGKVTVVDCYSTTQLVDADGGGVTDELHLVRNTTQESGSGTGAPAIDLDFSGSIIEKLSIVDNNLHNPLGVGIYLQGQDHFRIAGNTIEDAREHGIHLVNCDDGFVQANQIIDPGQQTANTYDGIILAGDTNAVDIRDNAVYIVTASQARHGINVSAATCDDNSYLGNRVTGTPGTSDYNDSGTGTVNAWPGSAAPVGDNL